MEKYNNLLLRIAGDFAIKKGKTESNNQLKVRIIYTLLGKMALASLFDVLEDEETSIVHLKNRIKKVFESYKEIYPEIKSILPEDGEEIANEIYDIYLHTGVVYHKPNHIVPAMRSEATKDNILFIRGYELSAKVKMSGLGAYMDEFHNDIGQDVISMFHLEKSTLSERWEKCCKNAMWSKLSVDSQIDYLRTKPPFNKGYWTDKPDRNGEISLLRTGFKGNKIYYLYKFEKGDLLASQLPVWQVEDYNYRSLSNACLYSNGTLPPTTYKHDGDITYIHFGYLPAPTELYLWKLYSWPTSVLSLSKDFTRISSRSVFEAIQKIMMLQGYKFIEEK